MADMADTFRVLREESKARRLNNRERSAQRLTDLHIPFVVKNDGAHIIVKGVDFWPGTGLWQDRTLPATGRGIRTLLLHLETK